MPTLTLTPDPEHFRVAIDIPALGSEQGDTLAHSFPFELWDANEEALKLLSSGEACQLQLPYSDWRHRLAAWERSFKRELFALSKPSKAALADYRRSLDAFEPDSESAMLYRHAEAVHAGARQIPLFPEAWFDVGSFEVQSGSVRVSDPCYGKGSHGAGVVGAADGAWRAMVLLRDDNESGFGNGMRPARLVAVHGASADLDSIPPAAVFMSTPARLSAGVDSGQCGFFDEGSYPTKASDFEHEEGSAYKAICDAVAGGHEPGPLGAAIAPGGRGAASRTFIGDGSYDAFAVDGPDGKAVALCLVYDYGDPEFHPREPLSPQEEASAQARAKQSADLMQALANPRRAKRATAKTAPGTKPRKRR